MKLSPPSGGGRGRGAGSVFSLGRKSCLAGLGVIGDVPVRGRREAASRRSQPLRPQEMGGSRCGSATREVGLEPDQGHFCHPSWISLNEVLVSPEKNC